MILESMTVSGVAVDCRVSKGKGMAPLVCGTLELVGLLAVASDSPLWFVTELVSFDTDGCSLKADNIHTIHLHNA